MRQLLGGIALAALLGVTLPAVANDNLESGATAAPDTNAQTLKAKPKRVEKRRDDAMMQQRRTSSPNDTLAEPLNRRELQELAPADAATSTGSSITPRQ
jgi:hypothetical protein